LILILNRHISSSIFLPIVIIENACADNIREHRLEPSLSLPELARYGAVAKSALVFRKISSYVHQLFLLKQFCSRIQYFNQFFSEKEINPFNKFLSNIQNIKRGLILGQEY